MLAVGSRFGFYEIRRSLGAGAMGAVYEAWDPRLRRSVAVKVLTGAGDDQSIAARLLREARAAAALNHPNICAIYDVGEIEGTPFLAMEFVAGETLQDVVARGAVDPARVIGLGRQLAAALATAHAAGVVHRDLKSANVMLSSEGTVKVLDFGIAQRLVGPGESTQTAALESGIAGTLAYMAPEVLRGAPAAPRSDIWAVGIVLYEMLAGRLPFRGTTVAETAAAILHLPPPPLPPSTPVGLSRVIDRCLEKDASGRPPTATDLAAELDGAAAASARPPLAFPGRTSLVAVGLGALALVAVVFWPVLQRTSTGLRLPVDAVAVLPFDNLSDDPAQEYFSDGMTEQVITDLGRFDSLQVIARDSVMQYKRNPKSPAATARELGVDVLVDGSVQRAGDRVRVTAQLIAPEDGRVLWSDSFDGEARDILAMQAEIATAIARQVRATIAPGRTERQAAAFAPDPKAHDLYLLGRHHAYLKNRDSARRSVDYLTEATRIDPGFALAHAALAEAYRLREVWGGVPTGSFAEESRRAAVRALELEPALPEAHMAMAIYYSQREWNWAAADTEFALAIEGRPSLSDAHAEYSFHLQGLGRFDAAVTAAQRATRLDPLSPDHLSQEGRALFRARRYPEAIVRLQRALELDQNFGSALSRLIDVYLVTGEYAAAAALLQKRRDVLGEADLQTAQLYAKTGRTGEARALVAARQAAGGGIGIGAALIAVALGEHDAALDSLEGAVRGRRLTAFSLRDPRFDAIAGSPRFKQILKDMNLPE